MNYEYKNGAGVETYGFVNGQSSIHGVIHLSLDDDSNPFIQLVVENSKGIYREADLTKSFGTYRFLSLIGRLQYLSNSDLHSIRFFFGAEMCKIIFERYLKDLNGNIKNLTNRNTLLLIAEEEKK